MDSVGWIHNRDKPDRSDQCLDHKYRKTAAAAIAISIMCFFSWVNFLFFFSVNCVFGLRNLKGWAKNGL